MHGVEICSASLRHVCESVSYPDSHVWGAHGTGDKTIYGCVLMSAIVAIRKYTQARGLGKSYCQCSDCLTRPWASLAASAVTA